MDDDQIDWNQTNYDDLDDADNLVQEKGPFRSLFYFFEFILFLVLVLGNSTVIYIIKTNQNLRNKANVFVAVLASADLCFGFCTIFLTIIGLIYPWYDTEIGCKIGGIINTFFPAMANITLCFVSIDRLIFVNKPAKYQETCRFSRNAITVVYILVHSVCFATIPPLWGGGKFIHPEGSHTCLVDLSYHPRYGYFAIIYGYLLPSFILLCCFCWIFRAARLQVIKIRSISFSKRHSARRVLRDTKRGFQRTSKTLSLMVVLHFICWTPFIITQLVNFHVNDIYVALYLSWLLILGNSSLEPWVYGMYNPVFRRSVRRGFAFFYCKQLRNFGISKNRIRVYQVSPYI